MNPIVLIPARLAATRLPGKPLAPIEGVPMVLSDRGERGRTVGEVAADLGIGKSTLTRWRSRYQEAELLSGRQNDVQKELIRLRRENKVLRQERDLLKKAAAFFAKETNR